MRCDRLAKEQETNRFALGKTVTRKSITPGGVMETRWLIPALPRIVIPKKESYMIEVDLNEHRGDWMRPGKYGIWIEDESYKLNPQHSQMLISDRREIWVTFNEQSVVGLLKMALNDIEGEDKRQQSLEWLQKIKSDFALIIAPTNESVAVREQNSLANKQAAAKFMKFFSDNKNSDSLMVILKTINEDAIREGVAVQW